MMITVRPNVVPYAPVECVGPVQADLLDRVAGSAHRYVTPGSWAEVRAVRRLVRRNLLQPVIGAPRLFTITSYADHCNWLVNRPWSS